MFFAAVFAKFFRRWRASPLDSPARIGEFIAQNSAFIAQSSLYGYVKTRAGFEYFRLFDDAAFVQSVNIAKWNIYAACLGDLSLFCGAHLYKQFPQNSKQLPAFMQECTAPIFITHAKPPDAGEDYPKLLQQTQERIANAQWHNLQDNESPFCQSPQSLVYWAPVADMHKKYDAAIVRNSITFKWKEVRANFRRRIDCVAIQKILNSSPKK